MNRFRKYNLVMQFCNVRMIERATNPNTAEDYRKANDPDRAHFLKPPIIEYLVQTHKRFLGISYWKTLVKTTSYCVAKSEYYLLTVKNENIGF